ncbi:MAG: twin-arginine translocation signal domain-containing protein, partial [Chloroflexota bacterium]
MFARAGLWVDFELMLRSPDPATVVAAAAGRSSAHPLPLVDAARAERTGQTPVSRRAFLSLSAAAAGGLLLSACALQPAPPPLPGIIRVAMDALHPVFDVHAWNTPDGPRTFSPMFDALTFIDTAGQLRPALALAWSRLQPTV